MRTLFKHFLIDTITLYLISQAVVGIVFENGMITLLLTGLTLMLVTLLVKPVINILILPINLVTFGLFKWVGYALTLYLVTLIVPGFKLMNFFYAGYSSYWISLPAVSLSGMLAFIAFSFLIAFISSIIYWILK